MSTVTINTYLIQSDLHSISALEMLRSVMQVPYVTRLMRYKQIEITFKGDAPSHEQVDQALKTSYFFVNPNKEKYCLNTFLSEDSGRTLKIRVTDQHPVYEASAEKKASAIFKTDVARVQTSMIWVIYLNDSAPVDEQVIEDVVMATSRKKGLLMNPVSETVAVL